MSQMLRRMGNRLPAAHLLSTEGIGRFDREDLYNIFIRGTTAVFMNRGINIGKLLKILKWLALE